MPPPSRCPEAKYLCYEASNLSSVFELLGLFVGFINMHNPKDSSCLSASIIIKNDRKGYLI